jgi:hypothetical protein
VITCQGIPIINCALAHPDATAGPLAKAACDAVTQLVQVPMMDFQALTSVRAACCCRGPSVQWPARSTGDVLAARGMATAQRALLLVLCDAWKPACWLALQVESDLCSPHGSALAFMLIVNTSVGTLLPLHLAFKIEAGMKREWLRASGLPVPPELPRTLVVQLGLLLTMFHLSVMAARVLLLLPVLDPARCPARWERWE